VKDTGGGDFELAPEGNHVAVCYMVVDLGVQQTSFGEKHKILIGWELVNEPMKDGRPFVISQQYTASLSEKANLRRDLESWRGRKFTKEELDGFDVSNVVGVPCMISVVHSESNDKHYANVGSVAGLPKGMDKPTAENKIVAYSLETDEQAMYDLLPGWIQNKITRPSGFNPNADFDDDINF
jgi:hypothetical protein